jgi:hypothetical protein
MQYTEMKEVVKVGGSGKYQLTVVRDGVETTEVHRLFISTNNLIAEFWPHARRVGHEISGPLVVATVKIAKYVSKKDSLSEAQNYANTLRRRRDYVLKNMPKTMWPEIRAESEACTDAKLEEFSKKNFSTSYDAWKASSDFGLPHVESGYRTITLKSCGCDEMMMKRIRDAIENGTTLHEFWKNGYDYSVEVKKCEDGFIRAWLSQEFVGCGNGHYWILISPTQAIFCEND